MLGVDAPEAASRNAVWPKGKSPEVCAQLQTSRLPMCIIAVSSRPIVKTQLFDA